MQYLIVVSLILPMAISFFNVRSLMPLEKLNDNVAFLIEMRRMKFYYTFFLSVHQLQCAKLLTL